MTALAVEPGRTTVAGLDTLLLGSGEPVTLLGHGLAGTLDEVRPLAGALPGLRVLPHLSGHGDSPALARPWDFAHYAAELAAVAEATGARDAVGVSVSAGALLRLVAASPERFRRLVLVLPPALARPMSGLAVTRLLELGRCIEAGDESGIVEVLLADTPEPVRDGRLAQGWARRRAVGLVGKPAPWGTVGDVPVPDPAVLALVRVPVLVIGQAGDELHPLSVAEEVAAALPGAELLSLPPGGVLWTARRAVVAAIRDFLA